MMIKIISAGYPIIKLLIGTKQPALKRNGEQLYVSLIVSNRKDSAGNITGFYQVTRDISYQKKSEAELIEAYKELASKNEEKHKRAEELIIAKKELDFLNQQQQALFASIVISSDDAMLSKTLDGIITSWNYRAEKIFGYSADEIIGKNVLTLLPPQLQQEEAYISKKIQNGETINHY